jgi:hypothetical protein
MLNYISKNKRIKRDIGITASIIMLPFLFYLYNFIPNEETRIWKTNLFTIDSGFFEDVYYYCWLLSCNFLTLSILSIWYISCRQKWKTILLIPVFAEIIKISLNIDYSKYNYVNNGFYYSILIFIIYAYVLNYFSKKLKYKRIKKSVSELLNNEINNQIILLNKIEIKNYKSLKIKLKKLKKNKEKIEKKVYLKQLISLRDRLTI